MSTLVIEQDEKITIPPNNIEKFGVVEADDVDTDSIGSSFLIRLKKNTRNSIHLLKGCVENDKTDPHALKSIWKH